ncbi:site-specific DNA-methyltransferase [Helicobacter pylori]|nr:site-specific DNA-methyltransferase [Helicobacter pylori]
MTDKNQAKKMGINIIQSQQENNPLFDMLLKNFPQTIKDAQVSLSAIKMLLGFNESMNDVSGYELTWTGKGLANALYSEPCQKQLKLQEIFTPQTSANKHPNNAIIIGDNLDALKLLKSAYSEKIKMIYIDPPYNTKSGDFIYPDNFRQDYQKILREVGLMETDENGKEIESESLKFFKNTQGSKTHSGWLSFMLPRLKLARDLLKEDGVIFISIDDNECANLKILCDEIFGEDNFIETFLWNKTQTPPSASNKTRKTHEFILCYQKNKDNKKMIAKFSDGGDAPLWNETNSERILTFPANYVFSNLKNGIYEKGIRDKIEVLDDIEVYNGKIINSFRLKGHFRWKQETLNEEIINNVFLVVKSDKFSIRYCREGERIVMPTNEISKKDNVGTNETASKELFKLFDNNKIFNFNKPVSLIKYLISICSNNTNEGDIILDFFAGSGTTAHAVMELNAQDKGNREFILVQIDEEIKEDENAYDFCKNVLKSTKPIISDITIERVKRAAQKISQSSKDSGLDCGFKVYTLQDKAQIANDKEEITLFNHSNLTPFDKALNLALQCGKTLNQVLEIIIKDKLYKCEDAYFCIVCDKEAQEYLAKSKNEMIFLDGYEEIDLQAFLNLNASFKERLSVVY